jgi:predicted tellurium resistance membrane protein TerC
LGTFLQDYKWGFRLALKASQEVRKEDHQEDHREAQDNKEEEDPVVLAVVLVVVLDSAAGFLAVLTPVARVELEPVPTNTWFFTPG